jgi:excinuclease ABC subunit C
LTDIALAGLAKRDEELFVPWNETGPVILPSGSAGLYLVKRLRDEAHRFAITYHRQLRGKAAHISVLDDIVGLGEKRRRALLKAFGSLKRLRQATLAEIAAVSGIPQAVAEEVFAVLLQELASSDKD